MRYLIVIIALLFCMMSSVSNDYLFIGGWVMTIMNAYILCSSKKITLNIIDLLLLIFLIIDILSIFWCDVETPYYYGIANTYITISLYFLCRYSFRDRAPIKNLLKYLSVVAILITIGSIPFIFESFERIKSIENAMYISEFKFLISPYGMPLNIWGSLILYCFILQITNLIINDLSNRAKFFCLFGIFLTLSILILSFVRSVYICLIIYIPLITFTIVLQRNKRPTAFIFNAICAFSIVVSLIFYGDELRQTVSLFETYSQKQSFNSRIQAIDICKNMFSLVPSLGTGVNNLLYSLHMQLDEDDCISFFGNSLFQLIMERGIIGVIIILCIVLMILVFVVKTHKISMPSKLIISISFLIFAFRELTFPSYFQSAAIQSLSFVFLAMLNNSIVPYRIVNIQYRPLALILFTFCIFESHNLIRINNQINTTRKCVDKVNLNQWQAALDIISDSNSQSIPILFNKAIIYWNFYNEFDNIDFLKKSTMLLELCLKKAPKDYILLLNYAKCLHKLGLDEQSVEIFESLYKRHSKKESVQWQLTLSTDTDKALIANIINNPRILGTRQFTNYINTIDSIHLENIKSQIRSIRKQPEDAKSKAKLGKSKLWAGDTIGSVTLLEESLQMLPNLIEPRKTLYALGSKSKSAPYSMTNLTDGDTSVFLEEYYHSNFLYWYGGHIPAKYLLF